MVSGNATVPYKRGDYFSINLVGHKEFCIPDPKVPTNPGSELALFGGVEYLYGERENLAGAFGADQRVMIFFAASR